MYLVASNKESRYIIDISKIALPNYQSSDNHKEEESQERTFDDIRVIQKEKHMKPWN